MDKKLASKVRAAVKGQYRSIRIGRSWNSSGVGTGTPIKVVEGDASPTLKGQPYLRTQFSNGKGFSKTLYTPSTLYVEVGAEHLKNLK